MLDKANLSYQHIDSFMMPSMGSHILSTSTWPFWSPLIPFTRTSCIRHRDQPKGYGGWDDAKEIWSAKGRGWLCNEACIFQVDKQKSAKSVQIFPRCLCFSDTYSFRPLNILVLRRRSRHQGRYNRWRYYHCVGDNIRILTFSFPPSPSPPLLPPTFQPCHPHARCACCHRSGAPVIQRFS